jgi:hypothetical protein
MISYWYKFFDARGHVFGGEKLDAEDDTEAIAKGRVLIAQGVSSSYGPARRRYRATWAHGADNLVLL